MKSNNTMSLLLVWTMYTLCMYMYLASAIELEKDKHTKLDEATGIPLTDELKDQMSSDNSERPKEKQSNEKTGISPDQFKDDQSKETTGTSPNKFKDDQSKEKSGTSKDQFKDDQSNETTVTSPDQLKDKQSSEKTGMSLKQFLETVKFIRKLKLYDHIQDVLVHYIFHFMSFDKMTMLTKSGQKTVPITDDINRNLTIMARHSIHVEHTNYATRNESFDFDNVVNRFRYIRNNTVVLDMVVDHANASFNKHGEIENPEKIRFYNVLKKDKRFFNIDDLNRMTEVMIELQKEADPSVSDILTGKLHGHNSWALNPDDCIDIGDHARTDNASYTVLFYEAALRRFRTHDKVTSNETKHIEKIIDLYSPYVPACDHRISQLKSDLVESKNRVEIPDLEDKDGADVVDKNDEVNAVVDDEEAGVEVDDDEDGDESINSPDKKDDTKDKVSENSNGTRDTVNSESSIEDENVETVEEDMNLETNEVDKNTEIVEEVIDINDELCVREIIKKSFENKVEPNVEPHDEL